MSFENSEMMKNIISEIEAKYVASGKKELTYKFYSAPYLLDEITLTDVENLDEDEKIVVSRIEETVSFIDFCSKLDPAAIPLLALKCGKKVSDIMKFLDVEELTGHPFEIYIKLHPGKKAILMRKILDEVEATKYRRTSDSLPVFFPFGKQEELVLREAILFAMEKHGLEMKSLLGYWSQFVPTTYTFIVGLGRSDEIKKILQQFSVGGPEWYEFMINPRVDTAKPKRVFEVRPEMLTWSDDQIVQEMLDRDIATKKAHDEYHLLCEVNA